MTTRVMGSGLSDAAGRRLEALGALCGAAGAVLFVVGAVLSDVGGKGVNPTQSGEQVLVILGPAAASFHLATAVLTAASVALVAGFVALSRRLSGSGPASPSSQLVLIGGTVLVGLALLLATLSLALAVALESRSGSAALVLVNVQWEIFRLFLAPAILVTWATAWASIRDGALPTPFGWITAGYAALLTVALLPVFPAGLISLTFIAWLMFVSLLMAAQPRRAS